MTGKKASARWMLDRPAELIDLDKVDKPWWSRWRVGSGNFSLVQDGNEVAAISSALQLDENLGSGMRFRRTEVSFKSGGEWTISTHTQGPRQDNKVLGIRRKARWTRRDRVVEVKDGGEQIAYLAKRPNVLGWGRAEVKTSGAYWLRLTKKPLIGIWTGEGLTIELVKGAYVLTPASPIPLEAALLHWHFILGEHQVLGSGAHGF